ncbi:double-cubane-cluster-containing anaerobic reductase [Alkalilimnicola ehrlichii MLHE-1]|uniref:2-hydroxyglutaryl-CoA dehydratase, D-component n=1 Tax=Alkalilimnicola ehrlichii (strain ATCC BAA-1101 / DSM 17681 / MLHE-1) TaxID=187272 RepID=Q0AAJ8_ALKEH|nr:double-cubane-cluster-containing anaerobic reductase [Alkalilimnicola ehrlichii]ABI56139.1 2-hydroxyglutaryl-CoA dehydratase, D-component [Alkalilimnicola ehrlichii MLHE-1]
MSRTREIIHKRHGMESKETLRKLVHEFPDNPAGMDYFYALFERAYCDGEPLHEGRPVVGTLCVQAPDELVRACGGVPVRLCNGAYALDQVGAEHLPARSCPLVRATLGAFESRAVAPMDQLSLVINPTTCDQKKKAAEHIASLGYEVYSLEFPPVKHSEQAREYWRSSVRRFAHSLPRYTGRKLTRRRLRRALHEVDRAQAEYRRLQRLRQARPTPLFGKDAFLVTGAYFFDDLGRWTEALRALNDELEQRVADGFAAAQSRAPRILFTGSPPIFPNLKLPMLIEQSGAIVVADEVCSANRMLHDRVAVDEWFLYDMVDAIADRYLKPCTCPIFDTSEDRRRRLLELARSHHVDGVVYQAFAGCQVYEMEHRAIAQALQAEQLPVMYIETDYSPDDMGQLSTRVEAFVESLKAKRRRRTA